MLAWYVFLHSFTFNLAVSLYAKGVSYRQYSIWSYFLLNLLWEFLSLIVFWPLMLKVITDIGGLMSSTFILLEKYLVTLKIDLHFEGKWWYLHLMLWKNTETCSQNTKCKDYKMAVPFSKPAYVYGNISMPHCMTAPLLTLDGKILKGFYFLFAFLCFLFLWVPLGKHVSHSLTKKQHFVILLFSFF